MRKRNKLIGFRATEEVRQVFTKLADKQRVSKTDLFYRWLNAELEKEGMPSLDLK